MTLQKQIKISNSFINSLVSLFCSVIFLTLMMASLSFCNGISSVLMSTSRQENNSRVKYSISWITIESSPFLLGMNFERQISHSSSTSAFERVPLLSLSLTYFYYNFTIFQEPITFILFSFVTLKKILILLSKLLPWMLLRIARNDSQLMNWL